MSKAATIGLVALFGATVLGLSQCTGQVDPQEYDFDVNNGTVQYNRELKECFLTSAYFYSGSMKGVAMATIPCTQEALDAAGVKGVTPVPRN